MLAVLTAAAITLISAAILGGTDTDVAEGIGPAAGEEEETEGPATTEDPSETKGPAVRTPTSGRTNTPGAVPPGVIPSDPKAERRSTEGATREGVHGDHFEFGVHAPITFDGVPLNLAEDPVTGLKGYITYVNRQGGINGLKARLFLQDDRYTVQGGQTAADKIVKEIKPFIIEGTLGIDQIAKVAKAAKAAAIPYFAGGGPEPEFKEVGMYQIISNYDQYALMVADFICKYGEDYVGGEVRLGTTTLNSENILPVEKRLVSLLEKRKCVKPVDAKARGTIEKPTEQSEYRAQAVDASGAYGGLGANLMVPLQDPVTTSRQTLEWNKAYKARWEPKWTIANFAHDSDTALSLFQGEWGPPPLGTGPMRIISGACYYHPQGGGKPYDQNLCAKMGEAKKQWVSLGQVTYDENAGGSAGGKSSYNYNEESWTGDGSGGASGYQLVYFWHGAMKSIGTDPTREKFIAALNSYSSYSNLITSPLTFKGSPNSMIGAEKFVLLEAQQNLKWRQVTEITPGLVDHF